MHIMGWTSRQYEQDNTSEDIARLALYLEKLEQIEKMREQQQRLEEKGQTSVGSGTTGKYGKGFKGTTSTAGIRAGTRGKVRR